MLPLSRFTVLDLTRVRSGPTCVRQLADWGANVIKIEAPDEIDTGKGMGGERHGPYDGHTMAAWNDAGYFGEGVEFRRVGDSEWSRSVDFL